MDSRLLPPIPTPPSQRWREIRLLYLPRAVFILGVIAAALFIALIGLYLLLSEVFGVSMEFNPLPR